jgi:hypothetical protein
LLVQGRRKSLMVSFIGLAGAVKEKAISKLIKDLLYGEALQ